MSISRALTRTEVDHYYLTVRQVAAHPERIILVSRLGLDCGLRLHEAISLNIEDILDSANTLSGLIHINARREKCSRPRVAALSQCLRGDLLQMLRQDPRRAGPMFADVKGRRLTPGGVAKAVARCLERAGLIGCSFRSFRKTRACALKWTGE